jgi:hypothetical protein
VDEQDKPPLGLYAYEEIAKSLHAIDETYWSELTKMRVKSPFAASSNPSAAPPPPRLPEHLRLTLCDYARRLFLTESNEYPVSPQIEMWLTKLAERVTERVMRAVESLDQTLLDTLLKTKRIYGLTYHGLTVAQMREAIGSSLDEVKTLTLVRFQSVIDKAEEFPEATTAVGISEFPNVPESNDESASPVEDTGRIVERRRKMLEDYKAATGNPSERRIYTALNSGIYKPEFYTWKDGRLSQNSKTTKQFEVFLKAKKLPVRRNPTN